ncbi:hypothetical protein LTR37_012706 [Vermiconidia calcicola]|uniref:Uncharacterized protein n=1 Tax=Vermiconidia calcicola TaxID=1690605 RepID=A0ACC3N047_9PEZI|nr:hypothetical protein LTR37_012706 [Vermiconidia calcicola]
MDYFDFARRGNNQVTQDRLSAPLPHAPSARAPSPQTPGPQTPGRRPLSGAGSFENLRTPSSIRIRRIPSQTQLRPGTQESDRPIIQADTAVTGRRRSSSEPQRYGGTLAPPGMDISRQRTHEMPTITEGVSSYRAPSSRSSQSFHEAAETPEPGTPWSLSANVHDSASPAERVITGASAMTDAANAARTNRGLKRFRTAGAPMQRYEQPTDNEYGSDVVDLLDLVDPEVRTIGTLTNVQNSLFVPNLGRLVNRRPTYNLTTRPSAIGPPGGRPRAATPASRPLSRVSTRPQQQPSSDESRPGDIEMQPTLGKRLSISSNLSDSRYAVLPHGVSLEGWNEEEKAELDDHVRHLMHSRREGFRRSMRGFRQYVSKPLGLFVFVYALLVTLFGAAWVFCLIGWIYVGPRQSYIIEVVDNVLVALFALMGDGLAPFRAVDTYHMCFIARYYHMTWRVRSEKRLPDLVDHNDLPERRVSNAEMADIIDKEETGEVSVLKPIQQARLQYHQAKFSKAHTFYRPHETSTHHAFPLRLLVAIVVLLDFHSIFQVALGTCTWSIDYHVRPEALTATILACSLTCNITAGILISIGDKRTRKKDVLERMHRQELTEEALERMANERKEEEHIGRKSVEASRATKQREEALERERQRQQAGATIGPTVKETTPANGEWKGGFAV